MKISRQEVAHVAQLARLELDQEQIELFTGQFNTVLEYMDRLRRVDTSGVEPTSHAIPLQNVFMDDHVSPSIPKEEALANAPEKRKDCFTVPKVI
jgi:aspartyl-tRNA(Asn)/glutamyl-tRNA(Gln) amidotransferase subunit C